jgi:F0F1-type ATP synthase membrane subunit b/b'
MDTIKAIFTQLGVDSSLLPQFVVVFILFLLSKYLFLNHLQFVLENREEKTVKLESSADGTFEKVNQLSKDYKAKIDATNKEAMKVIATGKAAIQAKLGEELKKTEREINTFVEQSRQSFENELKANEQKFRGEVDGMASELMAKILN